MKKQLLISLTYCFFTTFLFLTVSVSAQVVKGKVVDAINGSPIPNASVYLNGSSRGTTSNAQGDFTLNTTETNIPLVVSCVGYQSEIINNYSNKTLSIRLSPRAHVLREVVIGGMSREEQMKIFITQFIGSNSKDCIISNPDDINFTYRKKAKILEADVSQPLIIYNKKLGYKITYFLTSFSHSPFETSIKGNYVFAEDTSGLKRGDVQRILKARDKAYFGSRMHFIRSLWLNDLNSNKFTVARSSMVYLNDNDFGKADKSSYNDLVAVRTNQKFFSPFPNVTIKYDNRNLSYVTLNKGTNAAVITANGFHDSNLIWSGKISDQRISELLPYEFEPLEPLSNTQKPDDLSQQVIKDPVFVKMIVKQDSFSKSHIPEKLYVQTDKPYYTLGDTIRLKAYLLNADYLTPSNRSEILYVELDDKNGKVAKRMMMSVVEGLAWGNIALDEKEITGGTYTLRAYTNWMRNFGDVYIFKKDIDVSQATGNTTLVKANFNQQGTHVETALQFTTLDGRILPLKDMELKMMVGKKTLSKNQLNTGMDGTLKMNFELPETKVIPNAIFITAKEVTKGITNAPELTIPVKLNRIEETDVQFMPEGGNLVAGIPAKIGFKALNEDGIGVEIAGKILDLNQKEVATIKTTHAGMGSVLFTPKIGESYTAKINGIPKTYALPIVKPAGLVLTVTQNIGEDSLRVTITATPELNKGPYYLIGQARGIICYAQVIEFNKSWRLTKTIPKEAFPTGIARFSVFDGGRQPLNERQVFIDVNDRLNINIAAHKPTYGIRDSVALTIDVRDNEGRPVQGVFSLAVTDDSQVKTDSLGSNILSNLLLTSDLKGNIEQPGYYFNNPSPQKYAELDNLMLTQGWIGHDWATVFKPSIPLTYQPEKEFAVKGKVTNIFGKPVEGSNVILFTSNPVVVKDTVTNAAGEFIFKGLFPVDTAIYKLQARNKRGKENNVQITMDEVKPPEFAPVALNTPWYVNSDTILINSTKAKVSERQAIANYKGEGQMLGEVTIKDRKTVKGSLNLNGAGEADQILDEEEMLKAGKMTLADLLEKKIKGFTIGVFPTRNPTRQTYKLNDKEIHFVIDGMDLDFFYNDEVEIPISTKRFFYLQSYLNYFTAEDIIGIEVMYNQRFNSLYKTNYLTDSRKYGTIPPEKAFIEITTRSKHGPFMKVTPGTYLFKTMAFTLAKQFYSPKYAAKNKTIGIGTDMRSTLHWEPNVITNSEGKATVSFFTADKPANYTLIIEGINLIGNMGYKRQQLINVKPLNNISGLK